MHSLTCMSVVVGVVRKPRPCNSYSRRRDRINSVLWRSYYKGGGGSVIKGPSCRNTAILGGVFCGYQTRTVSRSFIKWNPFLGELEGMPCMQCARSAKFEP